MKKFGFKNNDEKGALAQKILDNVLDVSGEIFALDHGDRIETVKVLDAIKDENGIACSEPECECFYYCRCNSPECIMHKLVDKGKMLVAWDVERNRMLSTFGW